MLLTFTVGTNDIEYWFNFARQIDGHGLAFMYENEKMFNHPPLMGYLAWAWYSISNAFDLRFAAAFKLPMVLADTVSAILLWNIWKQRNGTAQAALAVAAYGLSLIRN